MMKLQKKIPILTPTEDTKLAEHEESRVSYPVGTFSGSTWNMSEY